MLNGRTIVGFSYLIQFGEATQGFPYNWNKKKRAIEVEKGARKSGLWKARMCINFAYLFYLMFRTLESVVWEREERIQDLTLYFLWLAIYSLMCLLQVNVLVNGEDVVGFLKDFFEFSFVEDDQEESNLKKDLPLNVILVIFSITAAGYCGLCALIFYLLRRKPFYVAMIIFDVWGENIWTCVVMICFETATYVFNWTLVLFHIFLFLSYFVSIRMWLGRLKMDASCAENKNGPGGKDLAGSESLVKIFKTLLILNNRFETCSYPLLIRGHQFIIIPLTVLSSYNAIQLRHDLSMEMFSLNLLLMSACVGFQYAFYAISAQVHDRAEWASSFCMRRKFENRNYHKHFLKSFQKLPARRSSSFRIFRQWRPHAFLKRLFFTNMKIHFYLHGNIESLKG